MSKKLMLSIVIPAYNEERYLKPCLKAIARQTEAPDEVIVVDNNSNDKTLQVAKSFSFVKVIGETKRGIVHARNRGFDEAKGEIIGRMDADTILPPNWVEKVKEFYGNSENSGRVMTGGGYFINQPLKKLGAVLHRYGYFYLTSLMNGHYSVFGSNMAMPKTVWRAVKAETCRRTDIHEDIDLTIHLHEAGFPIYFNKRLTVGVVLRRVVNHRNALNQRMAMWHKTLRVHGRKSWTTTFIFSAALRALYPLLMVINYVHRLITPQS